MDEMKLCNKCETSQQTDFYKNKSNKDDYLRECKNCST